jgi:hypothetical protein
MPTATPPGKTHNEGAALATPAPNKSENKATNPSPADKKDNK